MLQSWVVPLLSAWLFTGGNSYYSVQVERASIEKTVQLYFDGIMKYDAQLLRKAFHPNARLQSVFPSGRYYSTSFEEWLKFTNGTPPVNTAEHFNTIEMIDFKGNAAIAKTDLQWPTVHYVDFLSLVKVNGEWTIINKIWHQEPRAQ